MGAMFRDRDDAGAQLAGALMAAGEVGRAELVLGIPRGGVVVAAAVARALELPLDVVLARKVGAPSNPELAIGAVGPDGRPFIDAEMAARTGADGAWIDRAVAVQAAEVAQRIGRFRAGRPPLEVEGKRVVVVDDGVATGSTALAVGRWLVDAGAAAVLAVPVGPAGAVDRLCPPYERLVAVALPESFMAVGSHYGRFDQTTDAEVLSLLRSWNAESR